MTSVWLDQRQFYGLEHKHLLMTAPLKEENHKTLNNKLLFKYTRISLVLADILNLSVNPSYGLEILLNYYLKNNLVKKNVY